MLLDLSNLCVAIHVLAWVSPYQCPLRGSCGILDIFGLFILWHLRWMIHWVSGLGDQLEGWSCNNLKCQGNLNLECSATSWNYPKPCLLKPQNQSITTQATNPSHCPSPLSSRRSYQPLMALECPLHRLCSQFLREKSKQSTDRNQEHPGTLQLGAPTNRFAASHFLFLCPGKLPVIHLHLAAAWY